jgi:hypothetical protein
MLLQNAQDLPETLLVLWMASPDVSREAFSI